MSYSIILVSCFVGIFLTTFANGNSIVRQNIPTNTSNTTTNKYDYVYQLHYILNEKTTVAFLQDLIYNHHDLYNVTTEDIFEFSNIKELKLNQSIEVLQKLNISRDVINVDNFKKILEISNMTFNEFYEKLKNTTNLSGPNLQAAFKILGVDAASFSTALTFGEPNEVYDVLKKGLYSIENFEEAAKTVGTDLQTFYENIKIIVLSSLKKQNLSYLIKLYEQSGYNEDFLNKVSRALNLTVQDVYRVPNLKKIVDDIYNNLNGNVTLTLAIGDHEMIIHRRIYRKLEMVQKIINIYAESVTNQGEIHNNLTIYRNVSENFAILKHNGSILSSTIELERKFEKVENCSYLTLNGTKIIENNVEIHNISAESILVKTDNNTEFFIGNPLICKGKLFGLASKPIEKNLFTFDAFFQNGNTNNNSIQNSGNKNSIFIISIITAWLLLLLF